ncbi:MAG: sodium:proton antiporter [Rhizobiaceae bacterium]|nr:sodium:proton antiporter [Rhizobiaceae bacterium]
MASGLLMIAAFALTYSMIAKRLETTILTAPMLFLAFGFILSTTGIMPVAGAEAALHLVAETTLIILLFLDAAKTDMKALRTRHVWPFRMLALGLPLSVLIGALLAWPFVGHWPIIAILLLAAILAPTDAALGQSVISNQLVPERERRALTVESGLNDGLALPLILLCASLTANMMEPDQTNWFLFGSKQLILGPLVGAAIGFIGGHVLLWAKDNHTTSEPYEGVGAIAMAVCAYIGADAIGGNGFIAAFVAGLMFGDLVEKRCKFIFEFTESEGQGLSWAAFLLIGLVLVPESIHHLNASTLTLILGSLLIARPAAIWLSLTGTDSTPLTRLFFGWFGPRGLATALFALMVVDRIGGEYGEAILHIAVNTVWISALLHGITAAPAAKLYGRAMARRQQD